MGHSFQQITTTFWPNSGRCMCPFLGEWSIFSLRNTEYVIHTSLICNYCSNYSPTFISVSAVILHFNLSHWCCNGVLKVSSKLDIVKSFSINHKFICYIYKINASVRRPIADYFWHPGVSNFGFWKLYRQLKESYDTQAWNGLIQCKHIYQSKLETGTFNLGIRQWKVVPYFYLTILYLWQDNSCSSKIKWNKEHSVIWHKMGIQ